VVYVQAALAGRRNQLKVCVLIPSYNESKTIASLIAQIVAKGLDVMVIDDGSVDKTAEIALRNGASVFRHEKNKGKGASLREGFRRILEKDYDAAIVMDGDNQHSPDDIPRLIDAARRTDADLIIGNRMSANQGMPPLRRATNRFMSRIISAICRRDIPDSQCGFRLIKRNVLKELNPVSSNYEIESETIIQAHHKGFNIRSIPVQTIYAEQKSRINPFVDAIRFFRYIGKIFCSLLFFGKKGKR
jgi:glycosyltransferase involved in cell wall biosynthesis